MNNMVLFLRNTEIYGMTNSESKKKISTNCYLMTENSPIGWRLVVSYTSSNFYSCSQGNLYHDKGNFFG